MEDRQELEKSIDLYKTQLRQVEKTLEDAKDPSQRESLESLKNDLVELIDLTLQTINQSEIETDEGQTASTASKNDDSLKEVTSNQSLDFDDEMSCFMAKIKNLEKCVTEVSKHCDNDDDSDDENFDQKLQSIKDKLQNMIGKKCSAPHNHTWGQIAYHNAIICGLDETNDYELNDIKKFRFRILFTNPTHREMIPCSYYLNGDCKFTTERCHYSHGELIAVHELKDYHEPDFTKLNNENCLVLAKLDDNLWHKGKVIYSNFTEKLCRIRLINNKKEINLNFENLLPMSCDDDDEDDSDSTTSNSDYSDDYENDMDEIQKAKLIERTLLNPTSNEALGDWEKHTRGIGSKLLKQMGYVFGTGLGINGEGIVIPISAQILPPGRSLDHCMELRENANGDKNLFSVEKKIKREQKKIELRNQKAYDNFTKQQQSRTDVFSFLNNTLIIQTSSKQVEDNKTMKTSSKSNVIVDNLSKHSTKNLNIEYSKICDNIRKTEKEISKIKESMQRHSIGTNIYKQLEKQLNLKNMELCNYKKFEKNLNREQVSRKNKDELFVF